MSAAAPADDRTALATARRIADTIAARHADEVDRASRFPAETIAALREEGLLSAYVPAALGGRGSSFGELVAICTALGQRCSASAMVFAMHQIQVGCIVRHGLTTDYFRDYCRKLVEHQWLIASVTSELGVGGDTRSSICAVEVDGDRFALDKIATTISYGAHADDLLVTCRRDPQAARSDQVMVLLRQGGFSLEQTSQWDTLGMRGTCSPGFRLASTGSVDQILPVDYAEVSGATMVPFSHILWAGVWLGIATDATARAAASVRAAARQNPGTVPPTALRLAELAGALQTMRAQVQEAAASFEALLAAPEGADTFSTIGFALRMNHLKIACSTAVVDIVQQALLICGIQGYRNGSPASVGRHLRDALSAPLMVGNDRMHAQNASLLLVHKDI